MDWFKIDVNPEPWAIGPVGTGRRGGKIWAYVGQNQQLKAYQEAVREEVGEQTLLEGDIYLLFLFWRQVRSEDNKNYADTTNLQKSTEDALQGCLYKNDRASRRVTSILMAQGPDVEGRIIVGIESYSEPVLPIGAREIIERSRTSSLEQEPQKAYDENPEEIF